MKKLFFFVVLILAIISGNSCFSAMPTSVSVDTLSKEGSCKQWLQAVSLFYQRDAFGNVLNEEEIVKQLSARLKDFTDDQKIEALEQQIILEYHSNFFSVETGLKNIEIPNYSDRLPLIFYIVKYQTPLFISTLFESFSQEKRDEIILKTYVESMREDTQKHQLSDYHKEADCKESWQGSKSKIKEITIYSLLYFSTMESPKNLLPLLEKLSDDACCRGTAKSKVYQKSCIKTVWREDSYQMKITEITEEPKKITKELNLLEVLLDKYYRESDENIRNSLSTIFSRRIHLNLKIDEAFLSNFKSIREKINQEKSIEEKDKNFELLLGMLKNVPNSEDKDKFLEQGHPSYVSYVNLGVHASLFNFLSLCYGRDKSQKIVDEVKILKALEVVCSQFFDENIKAAAIEKMVKSSDIKLKAPLTSDRPANLLKLWGITKKMTFDKSDLPLIFYIVKYQTPRFVKALFESFSQEKRDEIIVKTYVTSNVPDEIGEWKKGPDDGDVFGWMESTSQKYTYHYSPLYVAAITQSDNACAMLDVLSENGREKGCISNHICVFEQQEKIDKHFKDSSIPIETTIVKEESEKYSLFQVLLTEAQELNLNESSFAGMIDAIISRKLIPEGLYPVDDVWNKVIACFDHKKNGYNYEKNPCPAEIQYKKEADEKYEKLLEEKKEELDDLAEKEGKNGCLPDLVKNRRKELRDIVDKESQLCEACRQTNDLYPLMMQNLELCAIFLKHSSDKTRRTFIEEKEVHKLVSEINSMLSGKGESLSKSITDILLPPPKKEASGLAATILKLRDSLGELKDKLQKLNTGLETLKSCLSAV